MTLISVERPEVDRPASSAGVVEAVLQAFPRPALAIASDTRVTAANSSAREMLPALRIGDPLVLSLRDPSVLDAVRRVDRSGVRETVVWRERVPVEHIFEITVAALDLPGTGRSVVMTVDDLTEVRRAERMRAEFIANASHELRTPLASLLGFVETLQGPARDDAKARDRFLAIMSEQARRMARLIDDLLSLSRIEQKRHIRPSAPVDLSAVVLHVVDTLVPLAKDNAVCVTLAVEPGVSVFGDRDELVRVAENLIENALKYGVRRSAPADDGGPAVDIGVTIKGRTATFTVRDNGEGIAPEHLPRLTERFYRVDACSSRGKGGTGLGLALVKHIVAHHRGHLWIDSTLGEGSVFTVTVPLFDRD